MRNRDRPHNLRKKFQSLDLTVNKSANAFIQNQYNDWFSNQIIHQLKSGNDPANIKVTSKLSDLKVLHTGVTVNKYSPKKVLPDYFFTNEKVLPLCLLPREKVLPLGKKCSPFLIFWLHVSRNILLAVFISQERYTP